MVINISPKNKVEIKSKGWTVCSMGLNEPEISKYLYSTMSLERRAVSFNYPLNRKYYPHLFHENIAAIESPFNKLVCNDGVEEFFQKLNLGAAIRELMDWKECHLQLARLFTMGRYKYRGNWHRDFGGWDGNLSSLKTIQVALYLKNQDGFRIFKYHYDSMLRRNDSSFRDPIDSPLLPFDCGSEYFDEIKGAAGTVLFFAPGIIHQGNSFTKRLDYHMRFSKEPLTLNGIEVSELAMFDFVAPDFYSKDFDATRDPYSPRAVKSSFLKRMVNSLNYYTCAFNLAKYLIKIKSLPPNSPWNYSCKANTIFQTKN